jgi:hypothetical protein
MIHYNNCFKIAHFFLFISSTNHFVFAHLQLINSILEENKHSTAPKVISISTANVVRHCKNDSDWILSIVLDIFHTFYVTCDTQVLFALIIHLDTTFSNELCCLCQIEYYVGQISSATRSFSFDACSYNSFI